jgi:hypothetical protein
MKFQQSLLTALAVSAAVLSAPAAFALVSLEDGKDHLFVDGSFEMGYDSNIFTNAQRDGGTTYQETAEIEFARRAGWIGVNATASVTSVQYPGYTAQNSVDPKLTAELTKQTGRTTGSLTLLVQKVDRSDVTLNTRDSSWNYDAGLNFQYPVIERYSFTGSLSYDRSDYLDQQLFTNMSTYTGNLYLYYILNEQRDLFIDYRSRLTDEANGTHDLDNALTTGLSGRVYGPFNGSFQAGYQERTVDGGADHGVYPDFTTSGSATWNINRKMQSTIDVARDFQTTATTESVDSTSVGLTFQDATTSRSRVTLALNAGQNKFIGVQGRLSADGPQRVDTFESAGVSYFYNFNEHLRFVLSYMYYRNRSNLAYADFPRQQVNLTVNSRW